MKRGQNRRRLLLGLVVSLLAHGLLLLMPAGRPPAPPPPTPIEFELLYTEAPSGPASEELGAPVEEARRVPAPRAETPSVETREFPPAAEPAPKEAPPPERGPVVRREEDGVWRDEALPQLDLDYRPKPPVTADEKGEPEGIEISEGRRIEERLEAYFREKRAEENARSRVEPAVAELRRRFDKRFSVLMEVLEGAPKNSNLGLGDAIRAYAIQAQRYGATGNPYEEDFLAPGAPGGPDTVASTVFRYRHADATRGPPISATGTTLTTLVARIEVERGAEGGEARVLEGSGVLRFDRLALEQVRRELLRVELPEDVKRMRWAFVSSLRVTPPGPTVGCSFDQAFIPQECFYPGSKHQRSRVYLEAIYFD